MPPAAKPKKLNPRQLQKLLSQVAQQESQSSLVDREGTPPQQAFIKDPCTLKAALCTRRSGKTYGCGLYLLQEALAHPGSTSLFIGQTTGQAKRIFVRDVLLKLLAKSGIRYEYNRAELSFTLSNGSVIYVLGGDASEGQKDKLLGQAYQLVVIDECATFRHNLEELVVDVLMPTMLGTIALIGTPGANSKGFFKKVTSGEIPGWSVHKWTYAENPYWKERTEATIRLKVQANPRVVETPEFRRNYYGEWVLDESAYVYRFDRDRNTIAELPKKHDWLHIIGLDLGYTDATAWVVCAYSLVGDKCLYVVHQEKKEKLELNLVAQETQRLIDIYQPIATVVDFASRQSVETLREHWNLALEDAEKRDKFNAIQMLNADLIQGQLKVVVAPGEEHPLINEWENLTWDAKHLDKGIYAEDKKRANHLCDAMLYAWRRSAHHRAMQPHAPPPGRDTDEWAAAFWKRDAERRAATADQSWFERDNAEFIGGNYEDW